MRWQPSRASAPMSRGSSKARRRCALGWALHDVRSKGWYFFFSVLSEYCRCEFGGLVRDSVRHCELQLTESQCAKSRAQSIPPCNPRLQ